MFNISRANIARDIKQSWAAHWDMMINKEWHLQEAGQSEVRLAEEDAAEGTADLAQVRKLGVAMLIDRSINVESLFSEPVVWRKPQFLFSLFRLIDPNPHLLQRYCDRWRCTAERAHFSACLCLCRLLWLCSSILRAAVWCLFLFQSAPVPCRYTANYWPAMHTPAFLLLFM